MERAKLHRNVVALGLVSLLTDLSSEMIYPLLPVFLTVTLAAGPAVLGLIEGVAETTASLLKLFSGVWSDRSGRKKPLVLAGYGLSTLARPLVGFASGWGHVLAVRFCDRIGKGVRTSPRDALVAAYVPAAQRGKAFGLQRSMDHLGAVLVPMGSAGVKGMSVTTGEVDAYVHAGGQFEWDSAAPVAVARAVGLHTSRIDGSPLRYNQPNPLLPDLVIAHPDVADEVLTAIASVERFSQVMEANKR